MTFSQRLIGWYRKNKRELPWRNTNDAYLIWLSEIILQQTRVDQGMPYYLRFVDAYPDVKSFAAASEDEILRLWQGLGYYSRGRNMLKTARKVVVEHSGKFPERYEDLIKLVGIGEYTASAISSFSSNEAKAVVDGNVYRFLSRYFGVDTPINSTIGKKEFQALADEVLDHENAGEHNQAMIEFGALQCKPKNPSCELCPFNDSCFAFEQSKVNVLPVKLKKLKIRERVFYFFLVMKNNQILMKRRINSDIWAGLNDLPSIEFAERTSVNELMIHPDFKAWFNTDCVIHSISDEIKHILTHQRLFARFVHVDKVNEEFLSKNDWFWVKIDELDQYGQPKLIFDFVKKFLN
ncbi:MAG: A/G-specific adenine glycosylase [Bacteroidetes bacterium]|nr:A/G-specific adenine glycosylase [Bacteroidota bacterium]MBU1373450.1 A/G-specific adenine glycosylase [Bacteroidota bacterium]MBU1485208.1 A/G-specific adenine glycosylase [Bacteroidota bacterium]MBU1761432.1 A/G-specific adenine glycosylase [Bacteroidota bacterium]MBU2046508.1 A/G-specific adenine glycosylase [Bacteroidota bacterium]